MKKQVVRALGAGRIVECVLPPGQLTTERPHHRLLDDPSAGVQEQVLNVIRNLTENENVRSDLRAR